MRQQYRNGFTIVELLIATTVFSVVLLVASTAMIQIGRLYYKGIISTRTQNATRDIAQRVVTDLQYGGSDSFKPNYSALSTVPSQPEQNPPLKPDNIGQALAVCIGDSKYTYWLGQQVKGTHHGIVLSQATSGTCSPDSNGVELLGENMRLTQFQIAKSSGNQGFYTVKIKVAYGDNDLLTTYNEASDGININQLSQTLCKSGIAGSNFCATSALDTSATIRVE